jgi:hypothetical protein
MTRRFIALLALAAALVACQPGASPSVSAPSLPAATQSSPASPSDEASPSGDDASPSDEASPSDDDASASPS